MQMAWVRPPGKRQAVGRGQHLAGHCEGPEVKPSPGPFCPTSLSRPQPLVAPTADDDLLGSSISCKTSSIPYHSLATTLGPTGPSSIPYHSLATTLGPAGHSSIPYHSLATTLGPAGPSSFGPHPTLRPTPGWRRSTFFDPPCGRGWDGDKLGWPGGCSAHCRRPSARVPALLCFLFPRPGPHGTPHPCCPAPGG